MSRLPSRHFPSHRSLPFAGALLLFIVAGCRQMTQQAPPKSSRSNSRRSSRLPSGSSSQPSGGSSNDGNLLLGNPSGAATDANNYLIEKPQYSLSFNHRNGGPNWVAWHTDESDLGSTDRGKFHPDPALRQEWQIVPTDYKGSGYDRGHVCPSGDRTSSRENNDATFCMSNMMPQSGELNRHVWADLENYVREQVRAGNEVYQVAGPAGNAGTIAGGQVVIPKACWKVIVVLPDGSSDLNRVNASTRVIAVAMPNVADKRLETADWRSYLTTARKIEDATHLDLFAGLSPNIKRALEQKLDSGA